MSYRLRKIPPLCFCISLIGLLSGKLKFSKQYLGDKIKMESGSELSIFRHITKYPLNQSTSDCVFIVSFKFSHLSHKANKLASVIPMLLITGFPGFIKKMYAVNFKNGYWQGMYQWKTKEHLEEYKKSFVFRMMNKRAIQSSISSEEIINHELTYYVNNHKITD
jgi:hypothetical protein